MAGAAYSDLGQDADILLTDQAQEEQRIVAPTRQSFRMSLGLSAMFVGSALAVFGWKRFHAHAVTSTLRGTQGLNEDTATTCIDGGDEFTIDLPKHEIEGMTVPAIPTETDKYAYATQKALVSIPDACYEKFKDKISSSTELLDREAESGTAYFVLDDLTGGLDTLAEMSECACGLLIEMHGSGGPGWSAVQFAAIFSKQGYVVVLPNSMAMPAEMNMKGKGEMKDIKDIDVSNYCGGYSAFKGSCKWKKGEEEQDQPYCYSTKFENVVADGNKYRKFVEGVYKIRELEMDYFVENAEKLLANFKTVLLAGNSEGAMAASRYHHPKLDSKLKGRILSAWSCNFNYFVSCADHAKICGDQCNKDVPQLNLIGVNDEYFGRGEKSMSSRVAADENGYGGPITGNCRATYDAQEFKHATVVEFEDAEHGPQYWDDNTWRNVMGDFIQNAGKDAASWQSLEHCTKKDGVFSCPPPEIQTCFPGWKLNPDASLEGVTPIACPPEAGDSEE